MWSTLALALGMKLLATVMSWTRARCSRRAGPLLTWENILLRRLLVRSAWRSLDSSDDGLAQITGPVGIDFNWLEPLKADGIILVGLVSVVRENKAEKNG